MAPMDTSRPQDRRQYPRTRVSWPVLIHDGATRYLTRSLNLSPFGAKVRTNTRLKVGTAVKVEVVPPEGPPIHVGATVWRIDSDGLAFLFGSGIRHRLIRETRLPAEQDREVAGKA